jgi:serine protease Do
MKHSGFVLVSALLLVGCASGRTSQGHAPSNRATLGLETSAPTEELAAALGLAMMERPQGRVVDVVRAGSAAERAGLRAGDVLLALDAVELYSQDDLDDCLRVRAPGATVALRVKRPPSGDELAVSAELGSEPGDAPRGIRWQFASLVELEPALERARAEHKRVLVGLSGAET